MAQRARRRFELDRVVVRTEPFSRIVGGDLGDADLALALITPTEQRDKVLDFSTPYIHAAPALVTRVGTEVPDVQTAQGLQFATGVDDVRADRGRRDPPRHAAASRTRTSRTSCGRSAAGRRTSGSSTCPRRRRSRTPTRTSRSRRSSPRPSRSRPRCRRGRTTSRRSARRCGRCRPTARSTGSPSAGSAARSPTATSRSRCCGRTSHDRRRHHPDGARGQRVGVPRPLPRGRPRAAAGRARAHPGPHRPAARRLPDRAARLRPARRGLARRSPTSASSGCCT